MLSPSFIYELLHNKLGLSGVIARRAESNGRVVSDLALAPLALGQLTDGVSLVELTHAYTVFPCDGVLKGGRTFYGVLDSNGEVIIDNSRSERRVFGQSTARIMNQMLIGVAEEGTARSITLKEFVDVAAKTGTSSGNRDKLLVGYTPYYTAGIWCGYEDGKTGVYSQKPNHISVWDKVMKELHESVPTRAGEDDYFETGGLRHLLYCNKSGCIAGDECIESGCARWGFFADVSLPDDVCAIHAQKE